MRIEELTLEEWEKSLPATGFEVFHTPEALRVIAEYVSGELRLLGGFRGQELVGLVPVFVRKEFVARATISPPPGFDIPRMGSILLPTSPKRRKQEKLNQTFTEAVFDALVCFHYLSS